MTSSLVTLVLRFMPPNRVASQMGFIFGVLALVWCAVQQASAFTHIEVQKTQFEQIIEKQKETIQKLVDLEKRIDAALLMQASRNTRQDVRDAAQDRR